jgi:hypothetical protein
MIVARTLTSVKAKEINPVDLFELQHLPTDKNKR